MSLGPGPAFTEPRLRPAAGSQAYASTHKGGWAGGGLGVTFRSGLLRERPSKPQRSTLADSNESRDRLGVDLPTFRQHQPAVKMPPRLDLHGDPADVIGVEVRDQHVVELTARLARGHFVDPLRIAVLEAPPAGIRQQRLSARRHEQRGRAAFQVQEWMSRLRDAAGHSASVSLGEGATAG